MRIRLAAVLVALPLAATARATTLVPADLNELATGARAIVYARIIDVRALESADRLRVESLVTAEAIGYVKGNLGRSVRFRVPGGTVGAYRTMMVGAPSFQPGEEVILFFGGQPSSTPYLLGFSQGVFRVRMDERTGLRMVVPAPAISRGTNEPLRRGTRAPITLDEFTQQVRALIASGPRERRRGIR
jgi:hypothetical protein